MAESREHSVICGLIEDAAAKINPGQPDPILIVYSFNFIEFLLRRSTFLCPVTKKLSGKKNLTADANGAKRD